MGESDVGKAERLSRARAVLMGLAALVLPFNLWLQFGDPAYVTAGGRAASWIVLIALWLFVLGTGGALRVRTRVQALINDELSLQNRSRALATGFYAAMLAALATFAAQWWWPIAAGDALKIVTAAALSAALLRYAWLEWR
jgi:hypothetical protein